MSDYQLIALDMDGTLLNSKKEISSGNLKMIEKAVKAGKEVILNTGRCPAELTEYIEQIPGLRYVNCTSGAMVYDVKEDNTIYSRPISVEDVRRVLKVAAAEDTMTHLLTKDSIVQYSDWERMEHYNMDIYKDMFERVAKKPVDLMEFYNENPFPVEKMNLYHTSCESRSRTKQRMEEAGLSITMAYSEISSLEISANNVDKGIGLKALCEYLNLPIEKTIVVGDADNDMGALREAGLAIAMENAKESIKDIADVIVADCDHDGVAEAIEKYLL